MKIFGSIALAVWLALMAMPVSGADDASLPAMLRAGVAASPSVRAARLEWEATIERIPQARALPDPMLMLDYFGENVETRVGPQKWRIGVQQRLPYPGTLDLAGDVAAAEARVKHAAYDLAVRDLITEISLSYHELVYLRSAAQITQQHGTLLAEMERLLTTRREEGKATLNDVLGAQSQAAQLEYDLLLLQELAEVETTKLNALLGRPSDAPIGQLSIPTLTVSALPLPTLEAAALSQRQEILLADRQIAKAREAIELARLQNKPSFQLSASYIETGDAVYGDPPDSGQDPWMIGVGVSIPLDRTRNRARVREAELKAEAVEARREALMNETRTAVKTVYFRLRNADRLMTLYDKTLLPQARQAMAATAQWHDGDTAAAAGMLETQSVWLNFNLARLRAATDYQQHRIRLERLIGAPLDTLDSEPEDVP